MSDLQYVGPEIEINANAQSLDEERDAETWKGWFEEARTQTPDSITAFIQHLVDDYNHDYGTICHAIAAAAVGAAHAVDHSPQGGITGFQAGAIFWDFARHWQGIEGSARLVQYDDMLYPQSGHKFEKVISADTWADLQEKANTLLAATKRPEPSNDEKVAMAATEMGAYLANASHADPSVIAHWQSIVDGVVPFGFTMEAAA